MVKDSDGGWNVGNERPHRHPPLAPWASENIDFVHSAEELSPWQISRPQDAERGGCVEAALVAPFVASTPITGEHRPPAGTPDVSLPGRMVISSRSNRSRLEGARVMRPIVLAPLGLLLVLPALNGCSSKQTAAARDGMSATSQTKTQVSARYLASSCRNFSTAPRCTST